MLNHTVMNGFCDLAVNCILFYGVLMKLGSDCDLEVPELTCITHTDYQRMNPM